MKLHGFGSGAAAAITTFAIAGLWVSAASQDPTYHGATVEPQQATTGSTSSTTGTSSSSSGGSTTAVGSWSVTYTPTSPTAPVKIDYTGAIHSPHTWYMPYGQQGARGWGTAQPLTSSPSMGLLDGEGQGGITNQSTQITASLMWSGSGNAPDTVVVYESSFTHWYGNSGSDANGINGSGFAERVTEYPIVNGAVNITVTPSATASSSTLPAGIVVAYEAWPFELKIDLDGVLDEEEEPRLLAGQRLTAGLVTTIPSHQDDEYTWTYNNDTMPYEDYVANEEGAVITYLGDLETQTIQLYNAREGFVELECEF